MFAAGSLRLASCAVESNAMPLVLVLDEFPEFLKTSPNLEDELRAIQNHTGKLPTRVLGDLVRARLLDKAHSVGEDPARSKRTYYRIADNFLAFRLACVEPQRGPIERGLGPSISRVLEATFDDYMGPDMKRPSEAMAMVMAMAMATEFGLACAVKKSCTNQQRWRTR